MAIITISLFSFAALICIYAVLVGADAVSLRMAGTVALLGVLSLFSMNAIYRLDSKDKVIRVLSTTSIISNIIWIVPTILIIWDFFRVLFCTRTLSYYSEVWKCSDSYDDFMTILVKFILIALIVSFNAMVATNFLNIRNYSNAILGFKVTTIASSSLLGLYFIPAIVSGEGEYIGDSWRFILIVAIIFVFSSIITPILVKIEKSKQKTPNDEKKDDQDGKAQEIDNVVIDPPINQDSRHEKLNLLPNQNIEAVTGLDFAVRLRELKKLYDEGILTDEEFQEQKTQVLKNNK